MGDNGAGVPQPPPPREGRNNGYKVGNDYIGSTFGRIFDMYKPKRDDTAHNINEKYAHMQDAIKRDLDGQLDKMFVILRKRDNKIHNMVEKLKDKFIDNPAAGDDKIMLTNRKVSEIKRSFATLTDQLSTDITTLVTVPDTVRQNYNTFRGTYNTDASIQFLKPTLVQNPANNLLTDDIQLQNMDDVNMYGLTNQIYATTADDRRIDRDGNLDLTDPEQKSLVTNRLKNCYILEHLYLKKHGELMNVFAFSLNMYEKYMIALNLLLFLIKYLVKYNADVDIKPGTYDSDCKIKIPKKVITNISDLLKDQKQIQETLKRINKNANINKVVELRTTLGIDLPTSLENNEPPATNPS